MDYRVFFYDREKHIVKAESASFETEAAALVWANTRFSQFTQYPVMELWTRSRMVERRERTA